MESLAGYDSRESVKDNRNDCFTASPVAEPLPSRDVVANLGASVTFRREEKGTKRGKVMLVDNSGYTYNINKQTDHATYWQCTVRPKVDPCKASVTEKDGTFKAGKSSHNHKAKTEAQKKKFKPAKAVVNEKMSTDIFTPPRGKRRKKENSDPHLSLSTQVKNMQISRNDSSSEDRNDSGFDTYTTPQDTSRNGDPLLSSINITRSPELDEYSPNSNCESTEEVPSSILNEIDSGSVSLVHLMDVESRKEWLKQYDHEVVINPAESRLQGGVPCIFTFKPELKSDVNVKASFGNLEPIILEKTRRGYLGEIPASPKMTPGVIPVLLISTTTGKILAETSLKYCVELYERKNLDGKPGASDSRRREDGGNDGGASGGGASGGRASGGRSSGGRSSGGGSSGEGAGGSGVSGDGTGGTGAGGCGGKGCGTYGGGATGCQYRIEASQLGSDVVSKLCELIQKCSVGIQRQEPSATQNKACIEAEEDLEDDQLSCTQESNENYFADTEDFSSVSSETDSALSDSESWDESLSDSPLSFPWVNSRSSKSQEAILETESTQHSREAVYSKLNVSHEIQELMTEGFTSEDSIGNNNYVGSGVCHKWNTSLPESKKTEENCEKDDHNKMQDLSQEWAFFSEGRTSHIQLASHDDTPVLCLDALDLIVENEESQYQDNELFEAPHAENAKPKDSESVLSVTSNQQSATHAGPTTQSQAPQSPVSNPSWNGDSKLNMAPPQCSDEEIHSGQEWEESGEGLASWFDLCENENAGKNERSRWEMSSIEPNKTDGGVEKDVFDSEEDLSQEQGLFSEQGNSHVHLSLPDDTSVQSRRLEVENEEIQDTPLFEAAGNGQTDVVRLLIENGADVNKEVGILEETPLIAAATNGLTDIARLLIENGADVNKGFWETPINAAATNGHTDIARLLIENGADVNKRGLKTPLIAAATNGHTDIARLLVENGADVNKERRIVGYTPLTEAVSNGSTGIVRLLIKNGADVNEEIRYSGHTLLTEAVTKGHIDIARLLIQNGADVNKGRISGYTLPTEAGRNSHTHIARWLIQKGAIVIMEGLVQLKYIWQMSAIEIELLVKILRRKFEADARDTKLSLERELDIQLRGKKTASLPKRPGKRLTNLDKAKQGHCVVVEIAKTHPSGDMIIIYGSEINEEGSGVGEAFQLATKDLKDTWENEEMIAENVQIGSVVKYVQVGDKFLFQGNTKRPRWDMDRIFLSSTDDAHRGIGNAFPNSKLLTEDSYQDCTPKETSCFISLKCGVVENDRISVITKLGELLNLKLNCREDVILPLSPSTLELSHVEDNKDGMEMEEPLLISAVDSSRKPSNPVLSEGLNLRDKPKETSVEAEKPEADLTEKDDEDGNAF